MYKAKQFVDCLHVIYHQLIVNLVLCLLPFQEIQYSPPIIVQFSITNSEAVQSAHSPFIVCLIAVVSFNLFTLFIHEISIVQFPVIVTIAHLLIQIK